MPKVIKNLREKLTEEARRQFYEQGYSAMTIRSVAEACEVSVGTIYNYFSSKNMLVASFVMDEWTKMTENWKAASTHPSGTLKRLNLIYNDILRFMSDYRSLISEHDTNGDMTSNFDAIHSILREDLCKTLHGFLPSDIPEFTEQFLSQSIIAWSKEGVPFDSLSPVIQKILD